MKYLAVILVIILAGCTTLYPVPQNPICDQAPYTGSMLCNAFIKAGLTAEQTDTMLLDAALVGIGFKLTTGAEARASIERIKRFIETSPSIMFSAIAFQIKVDPVLAILISRHMQRIETLPDLTGEVLDQPSKDLILKHLNHQMAQLSFFP